MNLTTIIEKKKEDLYGMFLPKSKNNYYYNAKKHVQFSENPNNWEEIDAVEDIANLFEKAIRESVEEALREVRPTKADMELGILARAYNKCVDAFDYRVKEFMK